MIRGEEVTVIGRAVVGTDAFNAPIYEDVPLVVGNVLVSPGTAQEAPGENRESGALIRLTLYFPKSCTDDLYGKHVEVRGERFKVIGHPVRYATENVPGEWNLQVEAEAVNG